MLVFSWDPVFVKLDKLSDTLQKLLRVEAGKSELAKAIGKSHHIFHWSEEVYVFAVRMRISFQTFKARKGVVKSCVCWIYHERLVRTNLRLFPSFFFIPIDL